MSLSRVRFLPLVLLLILALPAVPAHAATYGATPDQGETDDPLVDGVTYTGTTYYIDCTAGNDTNDGLSPATAWKTLDQVRTKTYLLWNDILPPNPGTNPPNHPQWSAAPSGSAFLFKRGCTFNGNINLNPYFNPTGNSGDGGYRSNYTFGAYGARSQPRPVILYATSTLMADTSSVINLPPKTVLPMTFRNLDIQANPAFGYQLGIYAIGSTNDKDINTTVDNAAGDGLAGDDATNMFIQNSSFVNNQNGGGRGGGVTGSGPNFQILNSSFLNNGRDHIGSHDVYLRHLQGALLQGNSFVGGANAGVVIHGTSTDVTIKGNDFYDNSNGLGIGGYGGEGDLLSRFLIEDNVIHDN